MNSTFEQMIDAAKINLDRAEGFDNEYSAAYAHLAIGQALIAIALELKRSNDRSELDPGCLHVLSDQEREEIKNKRAPETDKDLGW